MDLIAKSRICRFSYEIFCFFGQIKHSLRTRVIATTFIIVILIFATIVQMMKLVEEGFPMHLLIEIIPPVTTTTVCTILIPVSIAAKKKHEIIRAFMIADGKEKRSPEEIKIMQKHVRNSERIVMYVTLYFAVAILIINISTLIPQFLDIVNPLNTSRPRKLPFHAKYILIDEEKYYYFIMFTQNLSMLMISSIVGGSENVFVILIHYICGMFEVVGNRLENMMRLYETNKEFGPYEEKLLMQKIEMCIKEHRKVLYFAAILDSSADGRIFMSLVGTLVAFSVSLVELTNLDLINARSAIFTVGQIGQFFVVSCMGQQLIDASNSLSRNVYNSKWYCYPARFQKLIFMIVLRAHKPYALTTGYFYTVSIENFGQFLQTALSYCMVLRKFQ